MSRRSGILALALVAIVGTALFAEPAHACPVCFDRDDEARVAFLATAGLLTLLPFGLVLGTGAWLRRRAREVGKGLGEEDEGGDRRADRTRELPAGCDHGKAAGSGAGASAAQAWTDCQSAIGWTGMESMRERREGYWSPRPSQHDSRRTRRGSQ